MVLAGLEKRWFSPAVLIVLTSQLALSLHGAGAPALTAGQIIQRATDRAQRARDPEKAAYTYTKVTVTDQLDSNGRLKEHKQKVWRVTLQNGTMSARLLEVNGQPPHQADFKKQNDNDISLRQMLGGSASAAGNRDNFLTPELVARFDFELAGETTVGGRRAYELNFHPKVPEPPVHRLVDRLLNRISGKLWIDAEEYEISRADLRLGSEVDFLGGVAGCLRKLVYSMTRVRMMDGVWINSSASGDFEGRKLLESLRIRTRSEVSHFQPLATGLIATGP